jgi:hypothetical protein
VMPPKRKKRIAGQARVSSRQQKDELTIADQIKFLKDLFTNMGIFDGTNPYYEFVPYDPEANTPENPSFFVDEAYNAEEEDPTTKFYDILKRVEAGLIDVVAVWSSNRIFRTQDEVFRAKIVKTYRLAGARAPHADYTANSPRFSQGGGIFYNLWHRNFLGLAATELMQSPIKMA